MNTVSHGFTVSPYSTDFFMVSRLLGVSDVLILLFLVRRPSGRHSLVLSESLRCVFSSTSHSSFTPFVFLSVLNVETAKVFSS